MMDIVDKLVEAGIRNRSTATAVAHLLIYGLGIIDRLPDVERNFWVKHKVLDAQGHVLVSSETIKALRKGYLTREWLLIGEIWEGKLERVKRNGFEGR